MFAQATMNTTCEHIQGYDNATLFFGRVLPYLVQGLLYGGLPPYIVHITDNPSSGIIFLIKIYFHF